LFSFVVLGLLGLMLPGGASADAIVTVGGTSYDVTTFTGSFDSGFQTLGGTPWINNQSLAASLASAVGTALGSQDPRAPFGPLFAVSFDPSTHTVEAEGYLGGIVYFGPVNSSLTTFWATGSVVGVPAPEPGTLSMMIAGMLGLGLLAGMKRYTENHLSTTKA
jgi:hypothetical protein